jgi:hypothetical protein
MDKLWRITIGLVIGLTSFSILGFYKTYFGLFPNFVGTHWMVHIHVTSVLSWFALLISQAWLAKQGRFSQHRALGRLSYLLVPIIVVGFILATYQGQMKHKAPELLGATLFDGGLFLLFYTLAMLNRKNASYHAPYMILSAVPFINPGLGRFISPEVSISVEFLLIVCLLLVAYFQKKPYKPYLVALGSFALLLGCIVYLSLASPSVFEQIWVEIWG